MAQTSDQVIKRIKQIRKAEQRSPDDCAAVLDMSAEQYLSIEEGIKPLTLPEIELLAIYFRVPPEMFFSNESIHDEVSFVLSDSILPKFSKVRQKMILAKLVILSNEKQVTLEDIHQSTGIPKKNLLSYFKGDMPIPVDHLLQISAALATPVEEFFSQEISLIEDLTQSQEIKNWRPEYPSAATSPEDPKVEQYNHLINAIKRMPRETQAQVAKVILEKFKAL